MAAPIKIKKPVRKGEGNRPAINVLFKGEEEQRAFFAFRMFAESPPFVMDATRLARLLIMDFVREQKLKSSPARSARLQQEIVKQAIKKAKAGGKL